MTISAARPCFICNHQTGNVYFKGKWPIVKLGLIDIGFRVCDGCGLLRTDPFIDQQTLIDYYANMSSYSDFYENEAVLQQRERMVRPAIDFMLRHQTIATENHIAEIGCADGYLLHSLRHTGAKLLGIEPSKTRSAHAIKTYGLDVVNRSFEDFAQGNDHPKFDLIILCNILEHILEPLDFLKKIHALLTPTGGFYLEVPLLSPPQHIPYPGFFQFEHIQYFTPSSLKMLLSLAGLKMEAAPELDYTTSYMPFMRAYAVRDTRISFAEIAQQTDLKQEITEADAMMTANQQRELLFWQKFEQVIAAKINKDQQIIIWGAGIHTSVLLSRTSILQDYRLSHIIDSDAAKQGQRLGDTPIIAPDAYFKDHHGTAIVISTFGGEASISKLLKESGMADADMVRLYAESDQDPAKWFA